jgi:catechol 2,3-dioxygenase-like lactoylglutathione lyase family enzyme
VSGGQATSEIFSNPSQGVQLAFVQGPDDIKIELIGNPKLEKPVVAHHIHLASPDVDASVEWYHKHFGGTVGMRGAFREIRIAGIRLTFMDSEGPVKPTKGSALDHIGFEINGLKAYAAKLERDGVTFDRGYTQVARIKSAVAFLTDPVGTYIEVSEGLRQVGGIGSPAPLD